MLTRAAVKFGPLVMGGSGDKTTNVDVEVENVGDLGVDGRIIPGTD